MIDKKEVVRLLHYCNHVFNRETKRLYKTSFGNYKEVIPAEGIFTIKRRGEQHKFTEEELMKATQYMENVSIVYNRHQKRWV